MNLTRLHQVGAAYDDLEKTKSFYTDILGARYVAAFDPPGLLFFDFEGVRLLLEKGNTPATLYFWVNDIDQAYADLVGRGVAFDSAPHLIFPDEDGTFGAKGEEEWMAFFKDPGGNTLALATRR